MLNTHRMASLGDFSLSEPVDRLQIATTKRKIETWLRSVPFTDLLNLYRADVDLQGPLEQVVARLELFSDMWDFRRIARMRGQAADDNLAKGLGSARWLSAETGLSPEDQARVLADVNQLGLVHAQDPSKERYDYALVLGGARLSCLLRSQRAAEVMRSGVRVDKVGLLGAARPVSDTERDATDTYAPGAIDEFALMIAGAKQAFGLDSDRYTEDRNDDRENPNLSWIVRRFESRFLDRDVEFIAVSAPSSAPVERRANSADTLQFFLDQQHVSPGSRLLLITSQIYVPYVQLEAIRTVAIPRSIFVETIGFPGDRMPTLQGLSNTNHYLQEVRSTLQAARRFSRAYPG